MILETCLIFDLSESVKKLFNKRKLKFQDDSNVCFALIITKKNSFNNDTLKNIQSYFNILLMI